MSIEPRLSEWESFYVIVGSSGGALVGIQFVVVALLADVRRRASADAINAFATPTVVHFGVVLLVSAIMSALWRRRPACRHSSTSSQGIAVRSVSAVRQPWAKPKRARRPCAADSPSVSNKVVDRGHDRFLPRRVRHTGDVPGWAGSPSAGSSGSG
jgi:hypothetical protein